MATSPNGSLSYIEAKRQAAIGRRIKRTVWDNWLTESIHGCLEFVKAVQVYGSAYDRSYAPTAHDISARDWEYS